MGQPARQRFTFGEYVILEELARVKHEFLDGQVWAMAGGTPEHAAVCASITALLTIALREKPCRTFSSDLRIRVQSTGLGTYPDVTVICGHVELDPEDPRKLTATNPVALVEVLSASTETYDRGEKLWHYQKIPSLREVVLVAHDRQEIEVVRREADGSWSRHVARAGDVVRLESLEAALPVDEIYRNPLA
jgi:Uma2 family endonuclease